MANRRKKTSVLERINDVLKKEDGYSFDKRARHGVLRKIDRILQGAVREQEISCDPHVLGDVQVVLDMDEGQNPRTVLRRDGEGVDIG